MNSRHDLQSDALQFGFKKDSGYVHALLTFRESIQYFTSKGSRVFCVSLDASKAFDKVLHSGGLFLKLLQEGVSVVLVKLLSCYGTLFWVKVLTSYVVSDKAVFSHLCYSQYILIVSLTILEILAIACTLVVYLLTVICMLTT